MPRVVLLATDPELAARHVEAHASEWSGPPLALVLVSLSPVDEVPAVDHGTPWAESGTTGLWTLHGWTYGEVPAPPTPPPASSRDRRRQEEALMQERSRRLWDLVAADTALTPLLETADAVAAVDAGGIRSAFHLGRRHDIPVATNGLVPALVELAAQAG